MSHIRLQEIKEELDDMGAVEEMRRAGDYVGELLDIAEALDEINDAHEWDIERMRRALKTIVRTSKSGGAVEIAKKALA